MSPTVAVEVVADSPAAAARVAAHSVQEALDLIDARCSAHAWIAGTDGAAPGSD